MPGVAILLATATVGVDYGWEMTDDGQLEYIIQIEPHLLQLLKPGESITSEIDPRLARARRFRIRVGDETLSRELPPAALTTSAVRPIDTADSAVRAVSDEPTTDDGSVEESLSGEAASRDRWQSAIPPLIPERFEDADAARGSAVSSLPADSEAWSAPSQERPEIGSMSEAADEAKGDVDSSSSRVELLDDVRDGPPDNRLAHSYENRAAESGVGALSADSGEIEADVRPGFEFPDRPPAGTSVDDTTTGTDQVAPPDDDESLQLEVAAVPGPTADWQTPLPPLDRHREGDASRAPLALDDSRFAGLEAASGRSSDAAEETTSATETEHANIAQELPDDGTPESASPREGDEFDAYAVGSPSMPANEPVPQSPESQPTAPRRWLPFVATLIALFASAGLNLFLGWIAWDTYNRYQDLLSDLQHAKPHGIAS